MESNRSLQVLIRDMEQRLEMITKWLKESGLIVNEEKTEICLFYKQDHPTVTLTLNGKLLRTKKTINVLGVIFDSKMQWSNQVSQAISKSKKALHGIKLVKKYLTKDETKMLLTSNFYSILYYNCEIWPSKGLNVRNKKYLLSASSNALKILNNATDLRISYRQLHLNEKRALPMDFAKYRLAIQLFKIYNCTTYDENWMDMNYQQNFNARMKMFHINDCSKLLVGRNIVSNRLNVLNNQIDLDWLNLSLNSFKLKVKELYLTN